MAHFDLKLLAREAMLSRGLEPDYPPDALRQVANTPGPASAKTTEDDTIHDLRDLAWSSIDNDDLRDLDQLTVAEKLANGDVRVLVAIAEVDALVKRDSPVDRHAYANTTSVYTAGGIFAMLPERFSTDLTSLADQQERLAVVVAYVVNCDGGIVESDIYRAWVRNQAKLAYDSVAAWLDGHADMPHAMAAAHGISDEFRLQDKTAQCLRARRADRGALELETIEADAVLEDGRVVDMRRQPKNLARELIEDFMIAANEVAARYLQDRGLPSLRRVVRTPQRWDRIVELAATLGTTLPGEPDAKALHDFLVERRKADPLRFPDLSLAVVKLLGRGEYVVLRPGGQAPGHFGLAVRDYAHSTAPNRRFPDVIAQRLLKAAMRGLPAPYSDEELDALAQHCTQQEDAANKVERQVRKSAAALMLSGRIGEEFDALVTGSGDKGVWVRALHPPVEGRLVEREQGLDVGDRLQVRLVSVDVRRGFIDFARL